MGGCDWLSMLEELHRGNKAIGKGIGGSDGLRYMYGNMQVVWGETDTEIEG